MVNDVKEAIDFYVSNLGFELEADHSPAIAMVVHGNLTLLLAGPDSSAARPMRDGAKPGPGGGWSRIVLTFDDLESTVQWLEINKGLGMEILGLGVRLEDFPQWSAEKLGVDQILVREDVEREALQKAVAQLIADAQQPEEVAPSAETLARAA